MSDPIVDASAVAADPVPTVANPLSAVPAAEQVAAAAAVGVSMSNPMEPPAPLAPADPTAQPAETTAVPEAYEVKLGGEAVELSAEEVAIFKDLGLTNDNAQKLVQFFAEKLAPGLAQDRHEIETSRLMQQWGIQDKDMLSQRIGSLRSWADKTLPAALVTELGRTAAGVTALYNMMQSGATPAAMPGGAPAATREQLQSMLGDKRYWDGDPAYRQQVEQYAARIR